MGWVVHLSHASINENFDVDFYIDPKLKSPSFPPPRFPPTIVDYKTLDDKVTCSSNALSRPVLVSVLACYTLS